jgi:hypothetical protein
MAWCFVAERGPSFGGMNDDLSGGWYAGLSSFNGPRLADVSRRYRVGCLGTCPCRNKDIRLCRSAGVVLFEDRKDPLTVKSDRSPGSASPFSPAALFSLSLNR